MGKNKSRNSYELYKSIRRDWGKINPVTRIKDSDKIYSRKKNKQKSAEFFEEYLEEEYLKKTNKNKNLKKSKN